MRKRKLKQRLAELEADLNLEIQMRAGDILTYEAQVAELEAQLYGPEATAAWKKAHEPDRLKEADDFMWGLMLMMHVGGFEDISFNTAEGRETRKWFGENMKPWLDNAYAPWEDNNADSE